MGAWGTGISSNDTYADAYGEFFDQYDEGVAVSEISKHLIARNRETIADQDDANNFWFALAKAQWECKQLDPALLKKVRAIIESGSDLDVWRRLDGSETDIKKREIVLAKFLEKLCSEKPKARSRKRKVIRNPVFEKGTCLAFRLANGMFGGAVVLEELPGKGYAYNLVAATRLKQTTLPTLEEFRNSEVLVRNYGSWDNKEWINWLLEKTFHKDKEAFVVIGKLPIKQVFDSKSTRFGFGGDWKGFLPEIVDQQLDYEMDHRRPAKRIKINSFTKRIWHLW